MRWRPSSSRRGEPDKIMPLQSLDDHNKQRQIELPKYPRPNGIACPKCGKEMHDLNANVLTSIPPKKAVSCLECGHNDFALAR